MTMYNKQHPNKMRALTVFNNLLRFSLGTLWQNWSWHLETLNFSLLCIEQKSHLTEGLID